MTKWRVADEQEDPDPFGRGLARRVISHAYDINAHQGAHPITGNYTVRPDEDWNTLVRGERCPRCLEIVGRYPQD